MKLFLAVSVLWSSAFAQTVEPLPAVRMTLDPDQIFRGLRDKTPAIPASDCDAINLWGCREPGVPMEDVSLRWVQLDEDAEMEALLLAQDHLAPSHVAYAFDKQDAWMLVGTFECDRSCDFEHFIQVESLTATSPVLLLYHRDIGGSGAIALVTTGYRLRLGRLWPAFELTNYEEAGRVITGRRALADANRLVIHTTRNAPDAPQRNSCDVLVWNRGNEAFEDSPSDRSVYCDLRTGLPLPRNRPQLQ